MATRVTSKGQVTIPKGVRDRLGIRPGDRVDFVEERGTVRVRKVVEDDPFGPWIGFWKHLEGTGTDDFLRQLRGVDYRG